MATPRATATLRPIATPRLDRSSVLINEILPRPGAVDWNEDGVVDAGDAWIELTNATRRIVDISGWVLEVAGDDLSMDDEARNTYRFAEGTILRAGGFVVVHSQESGLILTHAGIQAREGVTLTLRLRDEEDRSRDEVGAEDMARLARLEPDQVLARDNRGEWQSGWEPTPGRANTPPQVPRPPVELDNLFQRLLERLRRR